MEKLIVNVPAFNIEAIKKDMFIRVKYASDLNNRKILNGIISKVEDTEIIYITSNTVPMVVHLHNVLDGKIIINVADALEEKDPVNHIIKEASIGSSLGYTRLNIVTQRGNHKIAGLSYDDVVVDGVTYTKLKG